MTYCMSDIHGQYDAYIRLLAKINLQADDTLYILGDVVDRGPQSMAVLLDMMKRENVIPLFGNHEYYALSLLPKLMEKLTEESLAKLPNLVEALLMWFNDGGDATVQDFKRLPRTQQQEVLAYLGEFSLYEELCINGQDYLLVHAGLANFSPERPLSSYGCSELIEARTDYGKPYFTDKIIVSGHTPTRIILQHNGSDTIFRNQYHIAIDCGAAYGGQLGAICLHTGEEFYA